MTEETGSFEGDVESGEEDESAILPLEKKKRMDTWASNKKKLALAFKTPVAPK